VEVEAWSPSCLAMAVRLDVEAWSWSGGACCSAAGERRRWRLAASGTGMLDLDTWSGPLVAGCLDLDGRTEEWTMERVRVSVSPRVCGCGGVRSALVGLGRPGDRCGQWPLASGPWLVGVCGLGL
jgi:hypothetical protein